MSALSYERPEYVSSLDRLRGLLALAVAVYHFASWTHVFGRGTPASSAVAVLGIYAVEGFFIISGFCFFHLYGERGLSRRELASFYLRRFVRLAPLYYSALALNVILARPVGPMTPVRILENLTLSFGLFHPNHARVLGGWSVGLEMVFYLAFPCLAWLTRRTWAPGVWYLGATTAALVGWALMHAAEPVEATSIWSRFHHYVELPNHAFLFLLGGYIASARRRVRVRLATGAVLILAAAVCAWAGSNQPTFEDHFDVMHGPARLRYLTASFLVVWLCALQQTTSGPVSRALAWLGDHSYAIYLLHPFASVAVEAALQPGEQVASFGLGLAVTLAFAAAGRRWVELPAIAWGRRAAK